MKEQPYRSFDEWEVDMNKVRAHPNDSHLLEHVKNRVFASSPEIQAAVNDYLVDSQFDTNPIGVAQYHAARSGKVAIIRTPQDPWWYC